MEPKGQTYLRLVILHIFSDYHWVQLKPYIYCMNCFMTSYFYFMQIDLSHLDMLLLLRGLRSFCYAWHLLLDRLRWAFLGWWSRFFVVACLQCQFFFHFRWLLRTGLCKSMYLIC